MTNHDALPGGAQKAALLRVYSRTVGVIQMVYASFFGWIAFRALSTVIQTEGTFKGVYFPAVNIDRLQDGIITAVILLVGFIGGYSLLGLRRWACRWEVAYLVLVCVLSAAIVAGESRRGQAVGYIVLFSIILTLPYLPFLVISPQPRDESCSCRTNG